MNAYAIGIFISLAVYLFVGNYAGRKVKHLEDYFVAGRQAPTLLIVGTLVASFMSTNAFLAETGMAYRGSGMLILLLTGVNSLGYVVGAVYFGRFLRRSRSLTVAEYFGERFDDRRVRVVAGITIIVGLGAYLMAVTQGAALIFSEITTVPYGGALVIVWAGYTLFTFYSGSRGVVITDTIMFLLFSVVAFVALGFIIDAAGGPHATITNLALFGPKPDIIAWHGTIGPDTTWRTPMQGLIWALIFGLSWGTVVAVSPWQASRYLMAQSEHVVIRSACVAGASILVLWIVLMFSGAAVNLSNPDIGLPENTMIWAAMNLMPTLAGALLLAGIMAAALSSASTFLSLVGFSVSQDVVRHEGLDDKSQLRLSRVTMLVIGAITLALALVSPPNIFWLTYFAGTVFASSWGPVAFMSVWSKRITASAAFWGIITGFVGNLVPKLFSVVESIDLPVYLDPVVIGAVLSFAVIVLISRLDKPSATEQAYRRRLHDTPPDEIDAAELSRTLLWPKALFLAGFIVAILLLVFYARPYAQALGENHLALTGETLLALGCGAMFIMSGLLAYYGTRSSYRGRD